MFEATIYQKRREALDASMSNGILLFLGNDYSPMNYKGNPYPFRQDSNFLYYFGIDRPGLAATIDLEDGRTVLYGKEHDLDDVVWTGPQATLKELAEQSGIHEVKSIAQLTRFLQTINSINRRVHYVPPYRAANKIKLQEWLNKPIGALERESSIEMVNKIVQQRSIKSPEEISEMEQAVNISANMHLAAIRHCQAGKSEADLYAAAYAEALKEGSRPAYGIILTVNGQTLHNHHHHNTMQQGQLVLADMGAESRLHYAGDITRTFPVDNTFTSQQKEIYQVVLDAQMEALTALRPDVSYRSIHLLAATKMAQGLKDLGLIKGDIQEAVQQGAHALFFPHGLGHLIGLDVHDMEDLGEDQVGYDDKIKRSTQFGLSYLRLGKNLRAGNTITVEPGIYFIPELMDQWRANKKFSDFINYQALDAYRNFGGIRIEDDVLITDEGHRILGNPIPKTIHEIENLR